MYMEHCILVDIQNKWEKERNELVRKLVVENTFKWQNAMDKDCFQHNSVEIPDELKYVGGIDISFAKQNVEYACVCIVVVDIRSLEMVAKHHKFVQITDPYIPNYLAFRETSFMVDTFIEYQKENFQYTPNILLVDGNGVFHSKRFGSACHLGVKLEEAGYKIPTIGVAKNYLQLDGLPSKNELMDSLKKLKESDQELLFPLKDPETDEMICIIRKPVNEKSKNNSNLGKVCFISAGHLVNLDVAVQVVRLTSLCRMPEPIRLADHWSKEYLLRDSATRLTDL